MRTPLRVLILEDNPADAEAMVIELRRAGFDPDWQRVDAEADFRISLDVDWDVILADYSLPQWDATHALQMLNESRLDIPLIIVSGVIGEDTAVECMRQGAVDYLLKDRMARLGQAVTRALEDKRLRAEKQQVQAALLAERNRVQSYLDIAATILLALDEQGTITLINRQGCKVLGYEEDELIGKNWFDMCLPESARDEVISALAGMFETDGVVEEYNENLVLTKTGEQRMIAWRNTGITNKEGKIVGILSSGEDISEQKQAERELRKLSEAIKHSPNIIFVTDSQGRIIYANPKFTEVTGYALDEALGRLPRVLEQGNMSREEYEERWNTIRSGNEWRGEFRNRRKNGEVFWERVSISSVKDTGGAIVNYIVVEEDITKRKQAEEALQESQRMLSTLMSNLPGMAYRCLNNEQWTMLFASQGCLDLTGYDPDDLILNRQIAFGDLIHPDDQDAVREAIQAGVEAQRPFQVIYRIMTRDGKERWVWEQGQEVAMLSDGKRVLEGFMTDITERKRAEEQLRESEERYRQLFNNLPEGIFQSTPAGRYLMVNPAFVRMLGYDSPEEVVNTITDISTIYADPKDRKEVERLFEQHGHLNGHEIRYVHRSGHERWVSIFGQSIYDDSGAVKYYDGFTVDITERKQAEEAQQRYAARLKLLHDIDREILAARSPKSIAKIVSDHIYTHITPLRLLLLDFASGTDSGQVLALNVAGKTELSEGLTLGPDAILGYDQLKRGEPVQIEDLSELEPTPVVQKLIGEGVRSILNIPMFAGDVLVGMLGLGHDQPGEPFAEHIDLLLEVGDQLAVAIIQARLREAERDQRLLAEALSETAHTVNNTLDLGEVLANIISAVGRVFPHMGANIMLTDADNELARVVQVCSCYTENEFPDPELNKPMRIDERAALRQMRDTGKALAVSDVKDFHGWINRYSVDWVRSYLGAPIMSDERALGFINLDSDTPGFFTDIQARRLQAFADQVAVAIRNARLFQELENYSAYLEEAVAARTAELQASEVRYRGIVEDQTELICRFTRDGTLTFVNEAYCRYFDKTPENLVGHNFMPQVFSEDLALLNQQLAAITPENPIVTVEHRIISSDDKIRWMEWTNRMLTDARGNSIGIQGVGRDITERKLAEQTLQQSLEREIALGDMRMRFLSMASHDLRNPLAVIRSGVDMVAEYGDRMSEAKKQTKYSQIRTSIAHMVELLDDVLIIGRAEAGKLEFNPEPIELETFCHTILSEIQVSIGASHTFEFAFTGKGEIRMIDPKLMRHILYNLLSNAIKYSPAQSTVTLDLDFEADQTVFRIQDDGIGIPPDDQPRLFKVFHRASNVGVKPGTGLGLAIVKQSVELHGGTISYETREGVGTTFTVTIPRFL